MVYQLVAGSSTTDYTAAASNDDTTTFGTLVYSAGAFLLVTKWLKTNQVLQVLLVKTLKDIQLRLT